MFADSGYEFCGIDQVGFGKSQGIRGRIEEQTIDLLNTYSDKYL
jgi:hypothetical protein